MNYFMQHKEAFIGSAIFVIAVLLFLLLCGLKMPDPPLVEECILLDFSTPTEESTLLDTRGGGGNPNAGASTANATTSNQNTSTQNSNSNSNSNPSVESQAFEDASPLTSGNDSKGETTENVEPTPTSRAEGRVNFGGLAGGNASGNGGSGTGSGNPGWGDGSGSGGGSGTGPGGIGGSIGNRKVTKVLPENKDNMTGTVKLKITVNEKGIVETAEPAAGTTCSECVPFAIKAVKQWKYEAKPGSGTQTGIVTVEFKLK